MRILLALMLGAACAVTQAAALDGISGTDQVAGLKEALTQGSGAAVSRLGKLDGYFGDARVKIPLPDTLKKAEKAMRALGMRKEADELILAMNRAAEAAVPEAKALLTDAVKKMTVQDAKQILTGGDTAATAYFKKHTEAPLGQKFLPIVKKATDKVGLAQKYNSFAKQGVKFGLVKDSQATIEQYVTQKALDGLYFMIGEEERAIRKDPIGQSSKLLQTVFGALK